MDEIDEAIARGEIALHSVYPGPEGAGHLRELFGERLLSFGLLATADSDDIEIAELTRRLRERGRDDESAIEDRLPIQREKIGYVRANPVIESIDGPIPAFDHIIVNDDFGRARDELLTYLAAARILGDARAV